MPQMFSHVSVADAVEEHVLQISRSCYAPSGRQMLTMWRGSSHLNLSHGTLDGQGRALPGTWAPPGQLAMDSASTAIAPR